MDGGLGGGGGVEEMSGHEPYSDEDRGGDIAGTTRSISHNIGG